MCISLIEVYVLWDYYFFQVVVFMFSSLEFLFGLIFDLLKAFELLHYISLMEQVDVGQSYHDQ
mgnify:FL=1